MPKSQTPASLNPESLLRRIDTVIERSAARLQKEADAELESARRAGSSSHAARELEWLEKELHELNQFPDELTEYGRHRVRELRAYRLALNLQLEKYKEHFNRRAQELFQRLEQSRRAARRARRGETPHEQLLGLVEAAAGLDEHLTATERKTLASLRSAAAALAEAAQQESEPEPEEALPAVVPLEPDAWEIADPDPELLNLKAAEGHSPAAYHLAREAQVLSLVRGFDVLLTPQLATGLAQYPHQIETARTVLRRMRGRALLCDEVGLGKTIEAGIIAREYAARGLARRILVLTPPALVSQWRQEMREKFGLEFVTHEDAAFREAGPEAWGRFDRILASLRTAAMPQHRESLAAQEFDLLIVDEAHHLRNRTSQAWKFVNELKKKYVLLLTATPVQNNLDELFNLITLLSPGQLKSSAAFRKEFVTRGDPRAPRNRERLRSLLAEVMVRNTRSQVSVALPPRLATTHRVSATPEEAQVYAAVSSWSRERFEAGELDRFTAGSLLRQAGSSAAALALGLERYAERHPGAGPLLRPLAEQARGLEQHAKVEQLCDLLRRRPEKTLVFTFFRETAHLLKVELERRGFAAALLSGELTAAQKDHAVAEFAAAKKVLISTDVGSEGKNLQFCRAVVNFDLPWNPMRIEQRVGRIHRIGQRDEVLIDNFCARGTIEDHLLRILDAKLNMFELVVGEIGDVLGNLEADSELEDLALGIWVTAKGDAEAEAGFDRLGEQLQDALRRHRAAQEMDQALFGDELAVSVNREEESAA